MVVSWQGADLAVILGEQERDDLEFKSDTKSRDAIRKAICALANDLSDHGFGVLLIGVDKHGNPTGMAVTDETLLNVVEYRNDGHIAPPPRMEVTKEIYKGVPVVAVKVWAASAPPVALDGRILIRVGPSTRVATRDEERVLNERRRFKDLPFDSRPVDGAALSDLDTDLFRSSYLPAAVDPETLAENGRPLVQQLASLSMATAEGVPTATAILVLGLDPTALIPGAYVQFVRYAGVEETAAIADDREMRGNLVESIRNVETVIRSHNRAPVEEGDDWLMRSAPLFPERALRELVLNALVHRNYETSYAPVRMLWFDDRIEITNPGGPFGAVRSDNFWQRNDYRNPHLAAAVKTLGYVNRFGRGIALVRRDLERNDNPPAEFKVEPDYWSVVVRKRG